MRVLNFGRWLSLAAGVLAVGLAASAPANAQSFAFGFSGYDGNENLILSTTGGPVELNTNGFQGWFSNCCGFGNNNGNTNYFTGDPVGNGLGPGNTLLNDFFAFNISSLGGVTVTDVTLSVSAFTITNDLTYRIGDASALANSGALSNLAVSPDSAIYNALGVGGLGSFALTPGESNTTLSFALNSAAVAAINADLTNGDSYFAVGGSVNSAIPEPSTWAMMLLGFACLGFAGYRKAKTSAVFAA